MKRHTDGDDEGHQRRAPGAGAQLEPLDAEQPGKQARKRRGIHAQRLEVRKPHRGVRLHHERRDDD